MTNELTKIQSNEENELARIFRDGHAIAGVVTKEIKTPWVVHRQSLRSNVESNEAEEY